MLLQRFSIDVYIISCGPTFLSLLERLVLLTRRLTSHHWNEIFPHEAGLHFSLVWSLDSTTLLGGIKVTFEKRERERRKESEISKILFEKKKVLLSHDCLIHCHAFEHCGNSLAMWSSCLNGYWRSRVKKPVQGCCTNWRTSDSCPPSWGVFQNHVWKDRCWCNSELRKSSFTGGFLLSVCFKNVQYNDVFFFIV